MTDTIHVAVYDTLADFEIGHLAARINSSRWHREPGRFALRTVGETGEQVTTMGGLRLVPDVALANVHPGKSSMLVLPGADTWDEGGNGAFAEVADRFLEAGVPVAAICGGTLGLASAGLFDDRRHTSSAVDYLKMAPAYAGEANYVDAPVVEDGGLITAGPVDSLPWTRQVLEHLGVFEPEVLDAWYRLFDEGDPGAFPTLAAAEQAATTAS